MDVMVLPDVGQISKTASILTSGGFLILAGSVVMVFLAQLIKLAVVRLKSKEVNGDWKKALSAIALLMVTIFVGYIKGLSIVDDGNAYLSIFSMIGYVSSMIYRFGLRWLFEKVDLTTTKVIEIVEENKATKEAKTETERG